MDYKDLKKYYWLKQKVEDLEREIRNIQCLGASVISDMPKGTKVGNPTEQYTMKKEKMLERLEKLKLRAITKLEEIETFISEIPDEEIECLFREIFILGYKQKNVARKHHMDRTTVYYKVKDYLEEKKVKK